MNTRSKTLQAIEMAERPSVAVMITLLLLAVCVSRSTVMSALHTKVCTGTSTGLTSSSNKEVYYESLKDRYENCTFLDGNLEIAWLNEKDNYDMSFLKDIQEITGYILIVGVHADVLPLRSLRVIRGEHLYKHDGRFYSLYVALNTKKGSKIIGLKEMHFMSLSEIMKGDVNIYNNNLLCYVNTIWWNDILTGDGAKYFLEYTDKYPRRYCARCHESCTYNKSRHCWGPGPERCQVLRRVKCSPQCETTCYGTKPSECCHPQCVGGCTGPTRSECWACRMFYNNETCVNACPAEMIYDHKEYKMVRNPNARYAFGNLCLKDCPYNFPKYAGACLRKCPEGTYETDGRCIKCDGACPKTCPGIDENSRMNAQVNANNFHQYIDCTKIDGSVKIIEMTFRGDLHYKIPPLSAKDLEVFSSVREITGYLMIQSTPDNVTDLSFFRNLQIIRGRFRTPRTLSALEIYRTKLQSLGLVSLKSIDHGKVIIGRNPLLCYADGVDWKSLLTSGTNAKMRENRPKRQCERENQTCDPQCNERGCWAAGSNMCLECVNYHREGDLKCVQSCQTLHNYFDAGNQTCKKCHPECKSSCTGPGPDHCDSCLHVKDGPYCASVCPKSKYPDAKNICQSCHENCVDGCTGPKNNVGPGACNTCDLSMLDKDLNVVQCLPVDYTCDSGYYRGFYNTRNTSHPLYEKMVCKVCHPQCKTCNGGGVPFCTSCKYYKKEGQCVSACPIDYYVKATETTCNLCDETCKGCYGPTSSDCKACKWYKVYFQQYDENFGFNCTMECPADLNHKMQSDKGTFCAGVDHPVIAEQIANEEQDKVTTYVIIASCIIAVILGCILIAYCLRKRARSKENAEKFKAKMTGIEESEPLTPTDALPDLSKLRLVKESELRKGGIIGSGAFGTVYKGVWIPEKENVKIPVAIKVLQEGTSANLNKELLEEARIMASVEHQCCVRILAVCMTAQMMLVTQLMPLGCLLDYVRKNRDNIGSKVLLNWCTQIARGMCYLEERGIVHRDLAARNVLVQNASQVKITDFGLAKLLDYDEEEFKSSGGKMPIKWLALECIQHRIFTHKSDIWSFGVTVWELFTYGQRPYENVRAKDVADLLEKGERLPQPSICTIDVYMIMIKCWMLDAESRPTFRELKEEFAKMARDPGRYLVIQGDKLMRLPSHTYDTRDLLRNMSIADADGPEEVMEADNYLTPTSVSTPPPPEIGRHPPANIFNAPLLSQVSRYDNDRDLPDGDSPTDNLLPLTKIPPSKYPDMSPGARSRGDSVNSRYSSDPCKLLYQGREPDGSAATNAPSTSKSRSPPQNQNKNVKILVDEDDYLQPKSSNPAAYMDLIDADNQDYLEPQPSPRKEENGIAPSSDYLCPVSTSSTVENPEYFENSQSPDAVFQADNSKDAIWTPNTPPSDGKKPEHDYYNEYDKLDFKGPLGVLNSKHAGSRV